VEVAVETTGRAVDAGDRGACRAARPRCPRIGPPPEELPPVELLTDAQKKKCTAVLGSLDVSDRDERLSLCTSIIGRTLGSSAELTKDEASRVIDVLSQVEAGDAVLVYGDDGSLSVATTVDVDGEPAELPAGEA